MDSLKIRLARAKHLFHELKILNEAFLNQKPFSIKIEEDIKMKRRIFLIESIPSSDSYINQMIILGDILHNLRSILDNLAYKLSTLSNNNNHKDIYFPFGNNHSEYIEQRNKRLKGIKSEFIQIIDEIKPYKEGGNLILWQLHRLNIIDKHRLILSAGGLFSALDLGSIFMNSVQESLSQNPETKHLANTNFGNAFSFFVSPAEMEFPLTKGTHIFIDFIDNPVDRNVIDKCRFFLAFNEKGVIEGVSIIDGVVSFINEIEVIIHKFDGFIN